MKDLGSEEGSVPLELTSSVVSFTLFRFDRGIFLIQQAGRTHEFRKQRTKLEPEKWRLFLMCTHICYLFICLFVA